MVIFLFLLFLCCGLKFFFDEDEYSNTKELYFSAYI